MAEIIIIQIKTIAKFIIIENSQTSLNTLFKIIKTSSYFIHIIMKLISLILILPSLLSSCNN